MPWWHSKNREKRSKTRITIESSAALARPPLIATLVKGDATFFPIAWPGVRYCASASGADIELGGVDRSGGN